MVENTSNREPIDHLAGILVEGQDNYITNMEARGQQKFVASSLFPVDREGDFEALGFVFSDPLPGDPLFCHAEFPKGWSVAASDHSMWSEVIDEQGDRRASVFYKAAFYDRRAFARLDKRAVEGEGKP
jgi:hypothetical protein